MKNRIYAAPAVKGLRASQADEFSLVRILMLNPCPAELFQLYFSSFEAGIANAIPSFKWRKM